ncbi:aminodeoxychorismate synthase component I [Lyngbya sp. CCY1209]|uniref:aminodeoxychorismate synthase component I n=1 Tax=Lyngbya sp. CCY1209 TaxID=2886103 RepID=UPI002D2124B1|nr:aminodeoxychorismate synthase component I [Lyngbya sp. CCY1209]MEB3882990.1 aminodeoxychorismate synthase component I [Lyngbya sp. CCY1209]
MLNRAIVHDAKSQQWLLFEEPRCIVRADSCDRVVPELWRVHEIIRDRKWYAAGFVSYEAGPAFDPALSAYPPDGFPLLWFGLYEKPEVLELPPASAGSDYTLGDWLPSVTREEYDRAITQIRDDIARGETYQVNYSFRLRAEFSGDPRALFLQLVRAQRANYGAFVECDRWSICSASPELFFHLSDGQLTSRPMKGTAARGRTLAEDRAIAQWLQDSEKNRAENVMIVDMVRNDMGRVADRHSVRVPRLFEVERYPTLWQMTSTVTAKTGAPLPEIFAALFPCASITGAPKPRTMQLIRELETAPRRIYTGCIGFMGGDRAEAQFNVAIRTVLVDRAAGRAEYGVGGGILWDSTDKDEYRECQVKARVLTVPRDDFSLLETMLWTPESGYFLLEYHLKRLQESALYFGFSWSIETVKNELISLTKKLPALPQKVRLLVDRGGSIRCETAVVKESGSDRSLCLGISPTPVDSDNPFLYHKTTNRTVYETARASRPDCDDVLLWNERGEVTESCIANLVFQCGGELMTPPVRCGLLPGTFREYLIKNNQIKEEIILLNKMGNFDKIYMINSVRKWREVQVNFSDQKHLERG